jgi:hypothetical protein
MNDGDIDRLRARLRAATTMNVSRADMVRLVLGRGLAGIDLEQPILEARPDEVLTPARVRALLGAVPVDTVRNALLVLAERGRIEKIGHGQYRARRGAA